MHSTAQNFSRNKYFDKRQKQQNYNFAQLVTNSIHVQRILSYWWVKQISFLSKNKMYVL